MSRVEWTRHGDDVEPLIAICLARRFYHSNRIRPSRGDGGIDILVPVEGTSQVDVYQVKRFAENLTASQKSQIEHSYQAVLRTIEERHLDVRAWNLTLPLNPTPENLDWLASFTEGAPFTPQWKDLDFCDGLAGEFPDVIDYYLHGGAGRLADALESFTKVIRPDPTDSPTLGPWDFEDKLVGIRDLLDKTDIFYEYDIRVSGREVPVEQDLEGLVVAEQARVRRDVWITHYVFARYAEATEDRPITVSLRFAAEPGSEFAAQLEDFHTYGTPVAGPATFDAILPGGLGVSDAIGRVFITPRASPERGSYGLRLQLVDEDDANLVTVRTNMQPATAGPSGHGMRAHGQEEHGVFSIDIRTNFQAREGRISYKLLPLAGLSPVAVVPGLRFLQGLRTAHGMRIGQPYGPLRHAALPAAIDPSFDVSYPLHVATVLATIQEHTTEQLAMPDLASVSDKDLAEWQAAAALLSRYAVAYEWETAEVTASGPDADRLRDPDGVPVPLRQPLTIELNGNTINLGSKQMDLLRARVDREQPSAEGGGSIEFHLIPHPECNKVIAKLVQDESA